MGPCSKGQDFNGRELVPITKHNMMRDLVWRDGILLLFFFVGFYIFCLEGFFLQDFLFFYLEGHDFIGNMNWDLFWRDGIFFL